MRSSGAGASAGHLVPSPRGGEIGSPHFHQVVRRPEIAAALKRCTSVFMPGASQDPDGTVTVSLGAKGVVELELVASGEKWGGGRRKTSTRATGRGSTARRSTSCSAGHPGQRRRRSGDRRLRRRRAPALAAQRAILDTAAARLNEDTAKRLLLRRPLGPRPRLAPVARALPVHPHRQHRGAGRRLHRAGRQDRSAAPRRSAKLDLRLVPDMTYDGAVAALKAHLAKRGFGDVEVNPSGGYDRPAPTPTRR